MWRISWTAAVLAVVFCLAGMAWCGEETGGSEPTYPGNLEEGTALERQAVGAFQEHQYAEAARLFEQAWEAYQHPRYQFNIGQCYRHAQQWANAVEAYQRRLDLEPAPPSYIYAHLGRCLLEARQREEANAALRRYLELEPEGDMATQVQQALDTGIWPEDTDRRPPEAVQAARAVHDRAQQLADQGEFEEAAEAFMEGYRQHNQIHELLLNAGLCYLWANRLEQGIEALTQYIETPGADMGALAHLAEARMDEGDLPAARDLYQRYLQRDPDGQFVQQARRVIRFIDHLDPVPTRANIADAKEHVQRAHTHAQARRYRQALQEYETAFAVIPSPTTRYNIGVCHHRMGQPEEALAMFLQYIEQMGDEGSDASVHLNAAQCLADLGRNDDAMEHINAYRRRADAAELPQEQRERDWATEIEEQCKND
ncbi:MAG: tetratricopeptide repeat protein [Verrucomicrobia bacterium]|nr:tetratricopeptide repeat protein [Verrucomicrobiota bacterium]